MIRYPGSKRKLIAALMRRFSESNCEPIARREPIEIVEPFVGGGASAEALLWAAPNESRAWLNDMDIGMACLWRAVLESPDKLERLICAFRPSVRQFDLLKGRDAKGWEGEDPVKVGAGKFALHQISFSGNGAMSGGPLGGREQRGIVKIDSRWNPERHCDAVWRWHRQFRRFSSVEITSVDFEQVLARVSPDALVYCDPPYVAAGSALYKHSMSDRDHRRLAHALQRCRTSAWLLSYDDDPLVQELYSWATIENLDARYSTAVAKGPRKRRHELVITPPR